MLTQKLLIEAYFLYPLPSPSSLVWPRESVSGMARSILRPGACGVSPSTTFRIWGRSSGAGATCIPWDSESFVAIWRTASNPGLQSTPFFISSIAPVILATFSPTRLAQRKRNNSVVHFCFGSSLWAVYTFGSEFLYGYTRPWSTFDWVSKDKRLSIEQKKKPTELAYPR